MKLIKNIRNVKYLSKEGSINIFSLEKGIPSNIDKSKITSVFAFILDQSNNILVIENKKTNRGFEIPGGHVENQESPEAALYRECYEESYTKVKEAQPIVLYEILDPLATKYPTQSYQCFYLAKVQSMDPFVENDEIRSRSFLNPESFSLIPWAKQYPDLIGIVTELIKLRK